jgi:hypothetical protein
MFMPHHGVMDRRDAVLGWAAASRARREEVVADVAAGRVELAAVLAERTDPLVGAIKLVVVVQAVPGVGKVAARRALARLHLDERRVADLSDADVAALLVALRPGGAGG